MYSYFLKNTCKTKFEQHNSFWQLSPMPAAKALSGLVPVKGTLYAVGGILQNSYATRELMSYNIERDTWTMLPQMKEVRYDPGKQKRKNPLVMNSKNRKNFMFKWDLEIAKDILVSFQRFDFVFCEFFGKIVKTN